MTPRQGFFAVLVSSFCFGFLGYFGKVGYSLGYTPLTLLTVRFVLASMMMWAIAVLRLNQKPQNKNQKEHPREKTEYGITLNDAKWLAVQGVTYALTALGVFNAYNYMPAGMVGVLFYIHPLLTILAASLLWHERLTKNVVLSASLAFIGAALVSQGGGDQTTVVSIVGFLWIMLSASAYSGFTLIGQRTTAKLDSLVVTTYSITFCALFLALLNPPLYMVTGVLTSSQWMIGLGISFVSSVLAILLYVVGIKAVGASRTAIISAAEPLSGVVIAALLLGERLALLQIIGMGIIVLSVWNLRRKTEPAPTAES